TPGASVDGGLHTCREAPSREEAKVRLQHMNVSGAVLARALGEDNFRALQREIGISDVYRMTEAQAEAVVRMQLGQLARLQRDEILREYHELRGRIHGYEELLSSERNVLEVIRKDLLDLRERYGEPRRTEIAGEAARGDRLDLIAAEEQAVTISHQGYIKRLPLTTYRSQRRGGRGVIGQETREEDFIEHFFVASTHAHLLCFTNRGQLYWLRVFEVPELGRTSA